MEPQVVSKDAHEGVAFCIIDTTAGTETDMADLLKPYSVDIRTEPFQEGWVRMIVQALPEELETTASVARDGLKDIFNKLDAEMEVIKNSIPKLEPSQAAQAFQAPVPAEEIKAFTLIPEVDLRADVSGSLVDVRAVPPLGMS